MSARLLCTAIRDGTPWGQMLGRDHRDGPASMVWAMPRELADKLMLRADYDPKILSALIERGRVEA